MLFLNYIGLLRDGILVPEYLCFPPDSRVLQFNTALESFIFEVSFTDSLVELYMKIVCPKQTRNAIKFNYQISL